MTLLLITILLQITLEDNSVTLSFFMIMSQIICKRVYFLYMSCIPKSMAFKNSTKIEHTKDLCKL